MKQRNRLILLAAFVVAAIVMLSGCDPVATMGEGTLSIALGSSRSLTLLPEIDMQIATYTISGSGPNGGSFTEGGFGGSVFERAGLAVGDWSIVVDGYNVGGTRIGTAVVELTIRKNQTTSATATLRPLEGTGTFSGTVSWTDSQGVLSDPQVWVTVRDEEGDDIQGISIPTRLDVEGSTASGSAQLPAGWYEVTVGLYEGVAGGDAMVVWQGVLALRIVAGQTTSGTLDIPEGQIRLGTGGVSIVIEEDMDNPLVVGFSGMPESVEAGGTVALTSTGTYSGSEQYRWYVNGVRQTDETTSSFSHTFDEVGTHTVSLLVLDGGALGGYGQSVIVTEEQTSDYAVGELGPSGGYVFYENPNYATDGWRYLEAAPSGWSGVSDDPWNVWGGYGTSVEGTGTAIGTGASNTQKIVTEFGDAEPYVSKTDYAAKLCADYRLGGHADWFLPSKDELNQMYQNLYLNNLGGFSADRYWSSSEYDAYDAWNQYFPNGNQNVSLRDNAYRVRPVRAF